jgi:hypothetical protein
MVKSSYKPIAILIFIVTTLMLFVLSDVTGSHHPEGQTQPVTYGNI